MGVANNFTEDADLLRIKVQLNDIEQPFSLTVKRNSNEEKIFRDATKMINSYYNEYKTKIKGLDTTSYYGMVALLITRLYIESSTAQKGMEQRLKELEKEIAAYLNKSDK